jgi:hypothetical protein
MRTFLLVALAVACASASQNPPSQNRPTAKTQRATEPDQRGTDSLPLVVKVKPTPKTQTEADEANADRDERRVVDGILILIGAIQTFVFCLQLRAFNAQKSAMNSTVREMQLATQEAKTSASGMLQETQRANRISLRAYVGVQGGTAIYQDTKNGKIFEGRPTMWNDGSTPAHKVRYWANAGIRKAPLPPDAPLPKPDKATTHALVLAPGKSVSMNRFLEETVSPADEERVRRGNMNDDGFYVWGRIDYEDAFGKPHWTNFCVLYWWQPPVKPGDPESLNALWPERHNEADRDE